MLTEPEEPPDRARRNSVKSDDLEHFDATIKARVKAAVALGADAIVVSASELATARGRVDARATGDWARTVSAVGMGKHLAHDDPSAFIVCTPAASLVLRAGSAADRDAWVDAIASCLPALAAGGRGAAAGAGDSSDEEAGAADLHRDLAAKMDLAEANGTLRAAHGAGAFGTFDCEDVDVFISVTGVGRVSAVPYVMELRQRGLGVDDAIEAFFANNGQLPMHDDVVAHKRDSGAWAKA